MKKYPATFALLLTSIALQVVYTVHPSAIKFGVFDPFNGGLWGWLGLITHQVSHGSWSHLIGNFMFGLPFMLYLEGKLGKERFLSYYFLCGASAAFFQVCLTGHGSLVGSSGAIAGVLAGACLAFGETLPEHAVAVVAVVLFLINQLNSAPMGAIDGVAYYAHVGGLVGGLILSSRILPASRSL